MDLSDREARKNEDGNEAKRTRVERSCPVVISDTSTETLESVRRLLSASLPVRISDAFYKQISKGEVISIEARLEDGTMVGQAAWGALKETPGQVYIYSLAVDSRYRREGIGTRLLKEILRRNIQHKDDDSAEADCVAEMCLHVRTDNGDAIEFYTRFGFKNEKLEKNFYARLNPSSAYYLVRPSSSFHSAGHSSN